MGKFDLASGIKPKAEKEKTFVFSTASLAEHDNYVIRQAMPDIVSCVNAMCTVAMLRTLRDKLGYNLNGLSKFYAVYQRTFEDLAAGRIKYTDLSMMLRDECNVNVMIQRGDGTEIPADTLYSVLEGAKECNKIRLR